MIIKKLLFLLTILFISNNLYSLDLEINSLRFSLSQPQTFHSLIYKGDDSGDKINFELEPINNERFGLFVDLNGVEIGYAFDIINDNQETKTQDFNFSYKKLSNSRFTINYQTLKGFETNSLNIQGSERESQFLPQTKSTKFEILGRHNLHTFYGKSLFDHFFLNRPKLNNSFDTALSLVTDWSYRRLKIENPNSLLFQPSFLSSTISDINKVNAESVNFSIGTMFSVGLKNNIHLFSEAKFGLGYFKNLNANQELKRSGSEEVYSLGSGASWTSSDQKTLLLLRAWIQKSRHVETTFGDLSVIYFWKI